MNHTYYKMFVEGGNYVDSKLEKMSDAYSQQFNSAIDSFSVVLNSDRADTIYHYNDVTPYRALVDFNIQTKMSTISNGKYKKEVRTKHSDNFKRGDIIEIENKLSKEKQIYLLTNSIETKEGYDLNVVELCNSTLKWKDTNNNSYSYPCIIRTKNQTINEDRYISIPDADAIVTVQYNSNTATIIREQRFTFGSQVFAVDGIDDISEVINGIGLIHFQMKWSQIKASDDLTNNYADNSEINDTNTESGGSGVLF